MAKQVIETLIDDLDGSTATKSVIVALDSVTVRIDLNDKHDASLRTALNPFLEKARRVRAEARGVRSAGRATDRDRNQAIRGWALAQGVELAQRGRIANGVQQAYAAQDRAALYAAAGLEDDEKPRRRRKTAPEFSASE